MIWIDIVKVIGFLLFTATAYLVGVDRTQRRLFARLPPKAANRDDEMVLVHEGVIDGDALRFTVRTKARISSFLVPREMVYQMSDDLLRAAAQLGKREQPQRGPE